jgi:hypothetical protein
MPQGLEWGRLKEGTGHKKLGRLRAVSLAVGLLLSLLSATAAFAIAPSDACSMAMCAELGYCCCVIDSSNRDAESEQRPELLARLQAGCFECGVLQSPGSSLRYPATATQHCVRLSGPRIVPQDETGAQASWYELACASPRGPPISRVS